MPKADRFEPGDLVFAKVKGYPAWPAKITSKLKSVAFKYKVFFYGTYEVATLKNEDIWHYNEERADKFEAKYRKKRGYQDGMNQIRNTPEIADAHVENKAQYNVDVADDESPLTIDDPEVRTAKSPPPLAKPTKRKAEDVDDRYLPYKKLAMCPSVQLVKTKVTADMDSDFSLNQTGDGDQDAEDSTAKSDGHQKKEAVSRSESRKLWVRVKDTDDIIEINLDKDRPAYFPSDEARQEWERASAKKALKFKKRIESGRFVPPEIQKKLDERAKLSPEEREQIKADRKAKKFKERLRWLKIEQRLVELDITVRTSLNFKRPSPDRCIQALEDLEDLGIAPLMLKKQSDIVSTIRQTRKYVGPSGYSEWTDEEAKNKLERYIPIIRSKSEAVFNKFMQCYGSKKNEDESSFMSRFYADIEKLKRHVESWDANKVLNMTRDPTQPLCAANPLSDLEDEEE